ncbi:MAG: MG2 domain-containing protein [Verrucomicrobiota bacterium]
MKLSLAVLASCVALSGAATAAPRLVVSTPSLTPESTIDLVLDSPAVAISELGKPATGSWLDIQPALPGKLVWKAQNIANWVPDSPPAMGTTYTFSISGDHSLLDGTAVPTGKFATVASEPFRVTATTSPNRWSSEYSPSTGAWLLTFNDSVDATAAENFFSFASDLGTQIPVRVEHPTYQDAGYYGTSTKPWAARFPGAAEMPQPAPDSPVPFMLRVTPDSPLPPAKEWKLTSFKGLPNLSATARLTEDYETSIGEIKPFLATKIRPLVSADEPRQIVIDFNDPVSEFLPVDFLTKCLEITPRPANLSARFDGRQLFLTGDLTAHENYSVTMRPPFTSKAGLDLAAPYTESIVFNHLDPELILPSSNEAQLANGNRTYRIQTVNLASLHVRIKRLVGRDLIRAYQGYRQYNGSGHDGEPIEPTAPLPYSLVSGETIFEKEIPLGNPIDTSREITLKWDEILPPGTPDAALFLDITGEPNKEIKDSGRRNAQALIQLTDIGLAWKLTAKEAVLYAFSCDTGAPLPGVRIELFGEDATALQSAATDASGLATVPREDAARHLHAILGGDSYLTAFDATMDTVGLWHFPVRYSWNKPAESVRQAFLFTDRSLYRPGETLRLKGIVRMRQGNAIVAADPVPARVVILDPAEKEIHTSPVTLSPNGSFDFTYTLPAGKTGTHEIRLEFPEELAKAEALEDDWSEQNAILRNARFTLPLAVEEFRRNAFEVTQTIAPPAINSASLTADLAATYYQGQPVAAGGVKFFSRVTARNPYPERFRDYLFGNHRIDDWSYWYHYFGYRSDDDSSSQVTQAQGGAQLSADGKASLKVEIPQAEFPTAREVTVSTEVTDANHQTLTATTSATVHPSSVYAGISRIDRLVRAGEPLPVRIVATGTDGEPFPGAVKLTATLTREVNSAVKSRTDTGATTTRNDVSEETVSTTELTLDPAASAGPGTEFIATPRATGRHLLTVRGNDPDGRPFATVTYFNVYGTDEYPWLYEDGMRVKLVAEKKSYKPGETARVLVLSPIEGTALVTVEREKVLRSFQVQLKADNPIVEIPLTEEDAPNAYVSVLIVKGAKESARNHKEPQLRLGYCELTVENLRDTLAVKLSAPESCRPADEVTVSGSVTLADGRPAAGAEITLYAEDEGTLAVMGYETPRPMDYFYQPRNLDVSAGTSFQTFIPEDPDQQYFSNKGFFIGGGGDLGKLADLMRKNFDPCATWAPALVTDAAGNFSHTFKVPDTLTRYRVIAVVHHEAARFGHTEASLIVKKDLMLEPKTPRFANQTDTFDAQVLVQNASTHEGSWLISYDTGSSMETSPVSATGQLAETVTLAAGASTTVVFPSRADHTGEAVLSFHATPVSLKNAALDAQLTHDLSDAVESRFQVQYPMPLLRQSKLVSLKKSGSLLDLRGQLDSALLNGTGSIELGFSRSPLVEAAGSVDYLLHYPYGCVEQTTSSLVPWLSVKSLESFIPRFAKLDPEQVAKAIQAGADRLLSMQLPNGSFAYWPGGTDTVDWATSYAGLGLILAQQKGAHVPPSAVESLQKNLIESLRGMAAEKSPSNLEIHARSLFVLALSGSAQSAYQNTLAERLNELTPAARSLLAAAIAAENPGNPEKLAQAKSILTSQIPFESKDDRWMPWSADDAYRLTAWLLVDPDGSDATRVLDRMLLDRNPYGSWRTTWVNGWSLLAMARYADAHDHAGETVNLTLQSAAAGETISLTPENPAASRTLALTPDLRIGLAADHDAFVRVNLVAKPRIAPIQPVATNGLSIDRIYERINPDGSATILNEPAVGDLIRVTLRVSLPKDDTRYLVIEDPLASIFETVNTDFASQRAAVGTRTSENDWNVSHSELRTDRAVFFLDHVWRKGTYTVSYLARCTLAGQAVAPPAKVESMYDPENFALSASRVFTSR